MAAYQAFLLGIANLLLAKSVQAASCYAVNGAQYTDSSFVPCDPDAETSPCCASNKGTRSDVCMSSGLCYAQDGDYRGLIFMNGCTDNTGLSGDCPHICPDVTTNWGGGSKVASWNVLQCGKGTYCCREASDSTNCCSNSTAIVSTDIGTLLIPTTTATSTVGTAPAATVTLTAALGVSATGGSSTENVTAAACPADKTAVVGGAVGGALGAALIASLGALVFMMRRRRSERAPPAAAVATTHSPGFVEYYSKPVQNHNGSSLLPQELSTMPNESLHELR